MATVAELTSQLIDVHRRMAANPEAKVATVTKRDHLGRIDEVTTVTRGMPELMDEASELGDQILAQMDDATPDEAAKAAYAFIDGATIALRYAKSHGVAAKAGLADGLYASLADTVVNLESYGFRAH